MHKFKPCCQARARKKFYLPMAIPLIEELSNDRIFFFFSATRVKVGKDDLKRCITWPVISSEKNFLAIPNDV